MNKELEETMKSPEFKRFLELTKQLETGERKKWVLPNDAEEFDEDIALENFKEVMKSGLIQEHIQQVKEKKLYGS